MQSTAHVVWLFLALWGPADAAPQPPSSPSIDSRALPPRESACTVEAPNRPTEAPVANAPVRSCRRDTEARVFRIIVRVSCSVVSRAPRANALRFQSQLMIAPAAVGCKMPVRRPLA